MTVITESKLEFTFGDHWKVLKYDEKGFFYKTQMENKVKPTKAADILCLYNDQKLLMLEVKNYSLGVPKREKFDKVPMAVAIKVRDTISGIVGGSHCASNETERSFFVESHQKMEHPIRVIYFFEDLATPARRPPKRVSNKKNVLLKQLKENLRWLTRDIAVVGLNDYRDFINDLTIRKV